MSRLESFIRRLEAQKRCLDHATSLIAKMPGHVLEIGLGNGRTYDHLRHRLSERAIYAFDRRNNAHPECVPPENYLVLGEFSDTLPKFAAKHGALAALAHCDTGSGDVAANARQAGWLGPVLLTLVRPMGFVLSDQQLTAQGLVPLPMPTGVKPGRYYLYQCTGAKPRRRSSRRL